MTEKEKIMSEALSIIANMDLEADDAPEFATSTAHDALDEIKALDVCDE